MKRFTVCFRIVWIMIAAFSTMLLSACTYVQHNPVPESLVDKAEVAQVADVRSWADDISPEFINQINLRFSQVRKSGLAGKQLNALALSGGGENGAFGAGLLNGWSDKGTRPEFEIVTGVSTGALIAPLAFLGRDYDEALEGFYTGISTSDILIANPVGGLMGGSALASNSPLEKIIAGIVDLDMMEKIAAQYNRGRRLYVITTNLEAQRPVIWNMGKIATYGSPEALDLFRSVLLASAAVPAAFPPVALEVVADGNTYTELHVDGGTTANAFVLPLNAHLPQDVSGRRPKVYVVLDGKLEPEFKQVQPQTLKIGGRAIGTLLKYKNYADLRRLYLLTRQRNGVFRMTSIPDDFNVESKGAFDKAYMNELYQLGYTMGRSGSEWTSNPDLF